MQILVAEDNPVFQSMLKNMLGKSDLQEQLLQQISTPSMPGIIQSRIA